MRLAGLRASRYTAWEYRLKTPKNREIYRAPDSTAPGRSMGRLAMGLAGGRGQAKRGT